MGSVVAPVAQWVSHHKVVVWIGLGLIAVASGGLALSAEGFLAGALDLTSVLAGGSAAALDYGPCRSGDQDACGAVCLGLGGAFAGLGGFVGDMAEGWGWVSKAAARPFKLASAVGYTVGGLGFAFDLGPGINSLIQFLEQSGLREYQHSHGTCPYQGS